MLSPLCQSEFSVRDSFTFVRDQLCVENCNYVMSSVDIVSLFTSVPGVESYKIVTSKTFNNSEKSSVVTIKSYSNISLAFVAREIHLFSMISCTNKLIGYLWVVVFLQRSWKYL